VQDVDGSFAAAKPGQAVLDRLAGYHGRLAGRVGQRQSRAQPGRNRVEADCDEGTSSQ